MFFHISRPAFRNLLYTGMVLLAASFVFILLFHTPTNLALNNGAGSHVATYWIPDTCNYLNKQLNPDMQLSGHTHNGQIFPFNFITHLLFNGHGYGLTRDGAFRLNTSCGTGSWGPPMRTSCRPEIVRIRLVSSNVSDSR